MFKQEELGKKTGQAAGSQSQHLLQIRNHGCKYSSAAFIYMG